MRIEYDTEAQAGYIYTSHPDSGKEESVKNSMAFNGTIVLDLDEKGELLGIEILPDSTEHVIQEMRRLKGALRTND